MSFKLKSDSGGDGVLLRGDLGGSGGGRGADECVKMGSHIRKAPSPESRTAVASAGRACRDELEMDAAETLRYAAVVAFSAVPRRYGSTMLRNTVGTSITPRPYVWPVGVCRAGRCWAAVGGFGDELAGRGELG